MSNVPLSFIDLVNSNSVHLVANWLRWSPLFGIVIFDPLLECPKGHQQQWHQQEYYDHGRQSLNCLLHFQSAVNNIRHDAQRKGHRRRTNLYIKGTGMISICIVCSDYDYVNQLTTTRGCAGCTITAAALMDRNGTGSGSATGMGRNYC